MSRLRHMLDRLIPLFRFKRIRVRFLLAMIILVVPALMLLGFISSNIAKSMITSINSENNQNHLRTSSEVADLLFRNVQNLHLSIVTNDTVNETLRRSNERTEQVTGRSNKLGDEATNRLQQILGERIIDTRFVRSICLFDLNFRVSCIGRSDDVGQYEQAGQGAIAHTDWYKQVYSAQGKVVYFPNDVLGESANVFSTVKLVRDDMAVPGMPIGLLVVNIDRQLFSKVFPSREDYEGFVVLDNNKVNQVQTVFSNAPITSTANTMNERIAAYEEDGYLISRYTNSTTGWSFLHLVQRSALLRQSNQIAYATLGVAALMGLLAVVLSYFISGTITRPLLQLKKLMLDWTQGKLKLPDYFGRDEVGTIGETFKRIVGENEELNQRLIATEMKEKEAELRALQAQIKPHFLYNTLDSIYWMATLQNNHEVARMAVSLSESFKLSLNKGRESITVYRELQHIGHYLNIQNIRFNNRFTYIEQVDEGVKGMEIMKLLLQPLVENAIYHGLEPKVGPGTVSLTGIYDDQQLIFTVEDDGVGMSDPASVMEGYGLRNVLERMKLAYGEQSTLEVESEPGKGTRVTLRFRPKVE
ncbi:sensor histidine kinase [Paenibacillus hunanensis]|uniref:sensor histidine kinase n=1 Tax=Paenibacillus hunanensis TaxID=539262 RepID=UPI002A6A3910|nr:sensor histidine kinase [Paenibacillus hunanensis]WPP42201.1 sensor histidine kinase [Paenibacillus hunanensis]